MASLSMGALWNAVVAAMKEESARSVDKLKQMVNAGIPILGSWNHILMAGVCGYAWFPKWKKNDRTVREYLLWYLRHPFMGAEDLSRIYVLWHLIPVLCIRALAWKRGDNEVFEACGDWLQAFAGYAALSSWPESANYFEWSTGKIKPSKGWACMFAGSRSWSHLRGKELEGRDLSGMKPGMKPIHHMERHKLDEVVFRMLTLNAWPESGGMAANQAARLAWGMVKGDPQRFWGISGAQATACRKLVKGDVSVLPEVLAMIEGHELWEDHLFLRGEGGVAVVNEREKNSISTSALYCYVYNRASVLTDGRKTRAVTWASSARNSSTRGWARYDWQRGVVEMKQQGAEGTPWDETNRAREAMGYEYTVEMGKDERLDIGPLTLAVRIGPNGVTVLDPETGEVPTDPPVDETDPPTTEEPVDDDPPADDSGSDTKKILLILAVAAAIFFGVRHCQRVETPTDPPAPTIGGP